MLRSDTRTAIATMAESLRSIGVSSEDWPEIIHEELEGTPYSASLTQIEEVLDDVGRLHTYFATETRGTKTKEMREAWH